MMIIGGQVQPTLLEAIQGLGLSTNLKLCLDAGDTLSYAGGSMTTTAGPVSPLTSSAGNFNLRTVRQVINAAQVSVSGSSVIVSFQHDETTSNFILVKAYIGHAAAAGDAYDFASTPVQLTFGGSAGFTSATANAIISSDPVSFALDETKNLVISFYCNASGDAFGRLTTLTGWTPYYKDGDDAATVDATGYTLYSATKDVLGVYAVSVVTGNGGQKWSDRSGQGTDFYRGTIGVTDSADPTFNGTVGGLSANEYWSFDGGDYFTLVAGANPSWVEPFHKDGATFTAMFGVFPVAGTSSVFGDQALSSAAPGISVYLSSNFVFLNFANGTASASKVSTLTTTVSAWNICGISENENGGASAGTFLVNGSTETFDPAFASLSASSAGNVLKIASGSSVGNPLASGYRLAWLAIWDVALTTSQMQSVYSAMRGRLGI